MNIQEIINKVEQGKGARNQIEKQLKETIEQINKNIERKKAIENIQALIQNIAKETQEKLKFHIEDIINLALDTCFPDQYNFIVDFIIKRGRTEASLFLEKDGIKIDPLNAVGGGVADIISFALRLSAWTLGKSDNTIILDEPFKFLSVDLRPLAGEILKELSKKLNIQIIMVTHDEEMIEIADKVFEISQKNGESFIKIKEYIYQFYNSLFINENM